MTDDKNKKPPEEPKTKLDLPRGIAVRLMRLHRPMQVPGKQADDNIKAETLPNGRRWEIEYIPQFRHHKITFFDPERKKEPESGFVHESHVLTWYPA